MDKPILLSSHKIPSSQGHVYMVTCIFFKEGCARNSDSRYWGFSFSEEEAIRWVMSNATDMFETGYYTHAVVEKVFAGLLPIVEEVAWFEATFNDAYDPGKVTRLDARPALSEPRKDGNFNWFEHGSVYKTLEKVTDIKIKDVGASIEKIISDQDNLVEQVYMQMLIPLCNELEINFICSKLGTDWYFDSAEADTYVYVSGIANLHEKDWLNEIQAKKFKDLLRILETEIFDSNFGSRMRSYHFKQK